MGFPMASSRADVLALWPADWGVLAIQHFCSFFSLFKKKGLWSSFQGQNHIFFSRSRWGGRGEFLATGEEEGRGAGGGSNSLLMCCTDTGSSKQCVWMLYCTVLRNSRDRQVTGRLLAVNSCYMGSEAVFAVWPSIKTQSAVAMFVWIFSRHTRWERGLV